MSEVFRAVDSRRRIKYEIWLVLAITFGMSGIRSLLRLIDSVLAQPALNQQQVTLNAPASQFPWLDISLQLCSATVLIAWGALGIFLLAGDRFRFPSFEKNDLLRGSGLAALIGVPGLAFYLGAVALGLSKEVIPSTLAGWWSIPVLLLWSFANAIGEEFIVVGWLMTRLRQLGLPTAWILVASSVLRGSYHLYQGFSAGLGNIIMGLVYGYYFQRTGKVWPLVIGHFLIDAVAFVGYQAIGPFSIPRF